MDACDDFNLFFFKPPPFNVSRSVLLYFAVLWWCNAELTDDRMMLGGDRLVQDVLDIEHGLQITFSD